MKKTFLLLFAATLFLGCNKSETEINIKTANYYVKYEATTNTKYSGTVLSVDVNTAEGVLTFKGGKVFEQTFGPYPKGFVASIEGRDISYGSPTVIVSISVARGQEPFALKATNSGKQTASATYTIDY